MPNAKWYAENYSKGDEVLLILEGVITNIDPRDDDRALALEEGWVDTLDKTTTPILGPEGYDKLVGACNLDELLAAIERKVGVDPAEKEPEYRTGCHWRSLKPGDEVLAPRRAGGYEVVEVQTVEQPHYDGVLTLCVSGEAGTYWLGDDDPQCPYVWPEGISYDD